MKRLLVFMVMCIITICASLTAYAAEDIYQRVDARRPGEAVTLIGKAEDVFRGDRFSIVTNQGTFIVQLDNIRCNDINEPYGQEALEYTRNMLLHGSQIILSVRGYESSSKALLCGTLLPREATAVEYDLLREGYADIGGGTGTMMHLYKQLADEAIANRKGIWSAK